MRPHGSYERTRFDPADFDTIEARWLLSCDDDTHVSPWASQCHAQKCRERLSTSSAIDYEQRPPGHGPAVESCCLRIDRDETIRTSISGERQQRRREPGVRRAPDRRRSRTLVLKRPKHLAKGRH